jgi:hypothetical protein
MQSGVSEMRKLSTKHSAVPIFSRKKVQKQKRCERPPPRSSHIMAAPPTGTPVKAEPAAAPAAKAAAPKPSIETIFKTLEYGE